MSGKVLVRGRHLYCSVNAFNAFKSWKNGGSDEEGWFRRGSEKREDVSEGTTEDVQHLYAWFSASSTFSSSDLRLCPATCNLNASLSAEVGGRPLCCCFVNRGREEIR